MFNIILFQPQIPPNTGNIIRLCANTGCTLHLIKPIAFSLEEKQLRRAGLDYHDLAAINIHEDFASCLQHFSFNRVFALSTKGKTLYTQPSFQAEDAFLLGPETSGLPADVLAQFPGQQILQIPHRTATRSLNLSNATAIVIYEAWRQLQFASNAQ